MQAIANEFNLAKTTLFCLPTILRTPLAYGFSRLARRDAVCRPSKRSHGVAFLAQRDKILGAGFNRRKK